MPTFDHELLVDLFRRRPDLARELLALCAGITLDAPRAELMPNDLTHAIPIELRADAIVVLKDNSGVAITAAIVEIQRSVDPHKSWSWPAYVATARANLRCPVLLLVVVPDAQIARWAGKPISLGHPDMVLRPIVIDLEHFPAVDGVHASPELAVLAAIADPQLPGVEAALRRIVALDEDARVLYSIAIAAVLPPALRKHLEDPMNPIDPVDLNDPLVHSIIDHFRRLKEDVLDKRQERDREQGREEGRAEALAKALRTVLAARFGSLEALHLDTIAGASSEQLERWIERAVTAPSIVAVFDA